MHLIRLISRHNPLTKSQLVLWATLVAIITSVVLQSSGASAYGVDYAATTYADRVVDRGYVTVYNRHIDTNARAYWYPRVMVKGSANWFAAAIMNSSEYTRSDMAKQSNADYISTVYRRAAGRAATSAEQSIWQASFKNGSQNRVSLVAWAIENLYSGKLTRPQAVTNCSQFNKGGPVVPLCDLGSAGNQKSVSILKIPNTSIYVNRVWYQDVDSFVRYAKTKGYTLDVSAGTGDTAWMLSPGSWRSWDEQNWLYTHINPETGKPYPANPPGKSMHEWGLALDLRCNGKSIETYRSCWDWVRANGGNYNIRNFRTVDEPKDSEAWHFSPNGL